MLSPLLHPQSVAVVGVSLEPEKVGHQIFINLSHFQGKVFAVNPKHKKILGKPCYENLLLIPSPIDLVVIATPLGTIENIVNECIDKKVKAVIVITAGFAETSQNGKLLQEKIQHKLATHDILLLGPNTLGALNPYLKLNASFAPSLIQTGSIGLISQSGAMLTTIFAEFEGRGVGCSFAISLGNKAGVDENQALDYAAHDPNTKIVAIYLESLANVPKFFTLCKQISKTKPVIILKGGTTTQGQQASLSHTAALATDVALLKEASHQMGFVLVETIEQFFEVTFFLDRLLAKQKRLPSNLMVLTNAGGPAVNAIDLASTYGITLAAWQPTSITRFHTHLPRVKPSNPTDLLGDAQVEDIELALEFANEDNNIESILLIITPQAVTDIPGITEMLIKTAKHLAKPLLVSLMGGESQHQFVTTLRDHGINVIEYANEAVEIYAWVEKIRKAQLIDRSDVLMHQLQQALEAPTNAQVDRKSFPLKSGELEEIYILLENYGFTLPRCAIATSPADVAKIADLDPERVFPLIAKTANMKLKHKAMVGGIVKDINDVTATKNAYTTLAKFSNRVLFQEVITNAAEAIIGTKRDPTYGPFIAVGLGGSLTNILSDRAYIFLPASQREIRAAARRTKLFASLTTDQREQLILSIERFARIMHDHPEIGELEINPLMLVSKQSFVADVKVEVNVNL